VNACLSEKDEILDEKRDELKGALGVYAEALKDKVGERFAYLDMVLKAVPGVAVMLREEGLPKAQAAEAAKS
jgi:hypothetical protein